MIDVSLLICTRNRRDSLSATLASIARAAGSTRLEVIVVDNGSTDDSAAMVRHWAAEQAFAVRLLVEPRAGLARARATSRWRRRGGGSSR
ncbi:glycosyltransferase family A protein [Sphingomonas sp. SORGH_AS_0789]|uniref:glycosyltransferase family A protein n=1 Tax=Sphingomonas sp. SORGH_AS_0789 TaxID=3041799 RepID=UPI002862E1D7|nr:glycosyltransferase involved in cell wall biosynthesis [Sphingomonas sp. SORGH_AS_0789]